MSKDVKIRILSESKSKRSIIKRKLMEESKEELVERLLVEAPVDPRDNRPANLSKGGRQMGGSYDPMKGTDLGEFERFGLKKVPYWDLKQHVEYLQSPAFEPYLDNSQAGAGRAQAARSRAEAELARRDKLIDTHIVGRGPGGRNTATNRRKWRDLIMDPHIKALAKEKKKEAVTARDEKAAQFNRSNVVNMTCTREDGCHNPEAGTLVPGGAAVPVALVNVGDFEEFGFVPGTAQADTDGGMIAPPGGDPDVSPTPAAAPITVAGILSKVRKDAIPKTKKFVKRYLRGDVSKLAKKVGSNAKTVNKELVNAIAIWQSEHGGLTVDGIAGPNTMLRLGLRGRGRRRDPSIDKAVDKSMNEPVTGMSPSAISNIARKELQFQIKTDGMNKYWVAKLKGGKSASGKLVLPGAAPGWDVFKGPAWRATADPEKNKREEERAKHRTINAWARMFNKARDVQKIDLSAE